MNGSLDGSMDVPAEGSLELIGSIFSRYEIVVGDFNFYR
jgi:hypothetical protein